SRTLRPGAWTVFFSGLRWRELFGSPSRRRPVCRRTELWIWNCPAAIWSPQVCRFQRSVWLECALGSSLWIELQIRSSTCVKWNGGGAAWSATPPPVLFSVQERHVGHRARLGLGVHHHTMPEGQRDDGVVGMTHRAASVNARVPAHHLPA